MSKLTPEREMLKKILLQQAKLLALSAGKKVASSAASAAGDYLSSLFNKAPKTASQRQRKQVRRAPASNNLAAAPVSVGFSTGSNQFSVRAADGLIADCTKVGAISISGRAYSKIGLGVKGGVTGDQKSIFIDGVHVAGGYSFLSFTDFDDRAHALASVYQYYRIRYLKVTYVPLTSANSSGNWALSVNDNWNPTTGTFPTSINSMMTSEIAAAGSTWMVTELPSYRYSGSKVWSCPDFAASTTPNDYIQLVFIARFLPTIEPAATEETGRLMFDYIVDFFEPRGNEGEVTQKVGPYPLGLLKSVLTPLELAAFDPANPPVKLIQAIDDLSHIVKAPVLRVDQEDESKTPLLTAISSAMPATQTPASRFVFIKK